MLKLTFYFLQTTDKMRSKLLEKRIEEIRKRKKKLLKDIKLIDDALNGLDELEDFVKIVILKKMRKLLKKKNDKTITMKLYQMGYNKKKN